eukprot:1161057-Pelagomonas_calceolata.AAC.7
MDPYELRISNKRDRHTVQDKERIIQDCPSQDLTTSTPAGRYSYETLPFPMPPSCALKKERRSKANFFGTSRAGYLQGKWLNSVSHQPLGLFTPLQVLQRDGCARP